MRVCDRCGSAEDLMSIEIYILKDKGCAAYSNGHKIMEINDYQPELSYIDLCPECLKKLATINTAFLKGG